MFYRKKKITSFIFALSVVLVLILFDQFTKDLAIAFLMNKEDAVLIPGVLQFHYLENTGAAFSLLQGQQVLFAIITPILILFIIYMLFIMPRTKKFNILNYVLLFLTAGAIGNYIDRIINHYVVDFIYFSLIDFPVFNVADCYVTVSVIVLFILVLFYYKDEDFEEIKKNIRIRKNG